MGIPIPGASHFFRNADMDTKVDYKTVEVPRFIAWDDFKVLSVLRSESHDGWRLVGVQKSILGRQMYIFSKSLGQKVVV
ncbi:hypothetical protein LCGC14_0140710 [marine sediment metagenome]|uniref:DUF4177 domain-containing protein n=1 Tax=marine sediment metagenome TaxID=412755 RepID=A0A0F9V0T8_9ZZZZ